MASERYDTLTRAVLFVGLGALALLPIGALGARFGLWGFERGFQFMFTGVFVAAAVLVLGIALLVFALRAGRQDVALPIGIGLAACIVALATMGYQFRLATTFPPINDITTDLDDPPVFGALEERGGQPIEYVPAKGEQQRQGYPHLATEESRLAPEQALDKARTVAKEIGWAVVAELRTDGELTIEAEARTFWFGFIDDVVIRIRPAGGGSHVDVRSASRVGLGDLGANAQRIDAFMERFRGGGGE